MPITSQLFGHTRRGAPVTAYRMHHPNGACAVVLDYGGTVQSLCVPDRSGRLVDVVLGYDTVEEYEAGDGYVGATIGRFANRIGGGAFFLNGQAFQLAQNDGENHLHGGQYGFDKQLWQGQVRGDTLVLSRTSPHGEEGYPGTLELQVSFTWTEDCVLRIAYDAETDQDTPLNLTNHSYFNLAGTGTVSGHTLQISAERCTETRPDGLPTGRLLEVEGTPFDFRQEKPIGESFAYDHNFVLCGRSAARLYCPETGIVLTVETDQPGMQVYTSNMLSQQMGKGGAPFGVRSAVCLETQLFPDGMHHYGFPNPFLRAGQTLHTATCYRFSQTP